MSQERLWCRRNGIRISKGGDYADFKFFEIGPEPGKIGGYNINAFDLTCETLRQVSSGFSGKRGFKIAHPSIKARGLKSARAGEPEEAR